MKQTLIIFAFFLLVKNLQSQNLNGLWYSSDSTRIYEIKQTDENKYIAIIQSSTRKEDRVGFIVINHLEYNSRKKRYEGSIYSVSDKNPAFVKIKFSKTDKTQISLKLSRMYVFDVSINWVKVNI